MDLEKGRKEEREALSKEKKNAGKYELLLLNLQHSWFQSN